MSDRLTILLFEPDVSVSQRDTAILEQAGFNVVAAASAAEASQALEGHPFDILLIAGTPDGEALARALREGSTGPEPLLSLVGDGDPDDMVTMMGADGFLLRPFSVPTARSVISVALRLLQSRQELDLFKKELEGQPPRVRRLASAINSRTGFYQFEFIKELLVVEVRRAKRYGFPLAIILVGLDAVPALSELQRPTLQKEITGGLALAIAKSIRDIDIPVHYADDRILVFLPHTDLAGAEEVGRRVKRRIKRITYHGDGLMAQLTASVGIAGINAGDNLTFSRLIKDASVALRAAQLKGGDRVMKRVARHVPEF